tara:strand:- start:58 stop:258 length:201 start_codon:yes stop_codon:yes gene_type:complete
MIYFAGPVADIETIQGRPWIRQSLDGLQAITKTTQEQPTPEGCNRMNHAEALILSRSPAYEPEQGA